MSQPVAAGGVGAWLAPQGGAYGAAPSFVAAGGGQATPAGAAAAHGQQQPPSTVAGMQVVVRMADGAEQSVPVQAAIAMGVVRLGLGGHPVVTELGRKSLARIVPTAFGTPAVAPAPAAPARRVGVLGNVMRQLSLGGEHHGATGARQGTTALLPMPHATATLGASGSGDETPSGSETLSKAASAAFLIRGGLKLAQGPGYPTWMTLYYFFNGMDRFTDGKFQPDWLKKGPLKDLMQFSILGMFLKSTIVPLPGALRQFRANKAALQAASGVSNLGAGGLLKAALKRTPATDAVAGAAQVAGEAAKGAELPFISKMFPAIKPLYKLGYTLSGVASLLALPEYMEKHGSSGMISTKSGRGAAMGAIGGALLLGSIYMPPSPLQVVVDFGSIAMWALEVANGKGWLDPMLGGDPPEPVEPAPAEGDPAAQTPADSSGDAKDGDADAAK